MITPFCGLPRSRLLEANNALQHHARNLNTNNTFIVVPCINNKSPDDDDDYSLPNPTSSYYSTNPLPPALFPGRTQLRA